MTNSKKNFSLFEKIEDSFLGRIFGVITVFTALAIYSVIEWNYKRKINKHRTKVPSRKE